MSEQLVKYLIDKVKTEIAVVETDLARGGAKDFADYRHACGKVDGFRKVLNILQDIEQRMETDEDD